MAQGVYYNQEVTAEMLNGIAADLGHTSFNGFGSEKFGADELNKITGDLVSAGVLMSGDMCRVVKDASGNIILQTGIIVFANGAKMEITSPKLIDADAGTVIYALNDTLQGKCTIEVAQSYPTEGDFVKLYTVGENKTLADNRTVAKAKVELNTGNMVYEIDVSPASGNKITHNYGTYVETKIPVDIFNKSTYIMFLVSGFVNHILLKSNCNILDRLPSLKYYEDCAAYVNVSYERGGFIYVCEIDGEVSVLSTDNLVFKLVLI